MVHDHDDLEGLESHQPGSHLHALSHNPSEKGIDEG
jgi:hypothetical protein